MIPLNSIIIFIKPSNMIVPIGITLTTSNAQLILPSFYILKNNTLKSTLNMLNLRQFFGYTQRAQKKENDLYYSSQMVNTQ